MRRIVIALLALVGAALLAAVAVVGAGVALSRGWQRERLRAALESALARELGADVAIGAIEGPLAPRVGLRELRVGPADAPTLELSQLQIDWDPAASWDARSIVIRSLEGEGLRIAGTRDDQGRLHAPGILSDDPGTEPFELPLPLRIERVTLGDLGLRIGWQDAKGGAGLAARGRAELGRVRWTPEASGIGRATFDVEVEASGGARRQLEEAHLAGVFEAGRIEIDARARLAPALGRFELRARGEGLDAVEVLALRLDGGEYPTLSLARPIVVRREGDRYVVTGAEIRGGDQAILLTGGVTAQRFADLRVSLREIDVSLLAGLAGAPGLAGRVSGELALDGALARPTGSARLDWLLPHIDGWTGDRIGANARWNERSAAVDVEVVQGGRRQLSLDLALPLVAEGALPWWERLEREGPEAPLPADLRVALQAHALELAALSRWLPDRIRTVRGALDGELAVTGGPSPRAQGRLAIADLAVEIEGVARPIEVASVELALGPHPGGVGVERLDVSSHGIRIEAAGGLALAGPRELALRAEIPDLAVFAGAYGADPAPPGSLEAKLRLDGAWRHPALGGSLVWRDPNPGVAGPSHVELDFASEGDWLSGEVRIWQAERVAARGEFRHPYPEWSAFDPSALGGPGAELDVRAEELELATLAPLLGRRIRDLRGRVDARVIARGGRERPTLEGTLRARDGSLRVPVLRQTFEPIEAQASFRDDALRIERLRIGREGAHAELTGSLRLDPSLLPGSAELDLVFERFPASRSPVLTTDLNGRARIEGTLERPILRGALALSDVRVRLADPTDPTLREIRVIAADAARDDAPALQETPRGPGFFDRAQVDLELSVPRNTWVRGQGANIEISGDLQLDKERFDPLRISGDVSALRGTYRFQGRRFDVRRGTATFDGGATPDPLLDVEARRRAGSVEVIVKLSGRLSEPTIRLSSEPDLPEDDVLSYLFFGRPAGDLKGATATQTQLEAAAGAFAAGIALGEASDVLEDLVPIDSFDVEMREDGRSADLSLGKYVTDDFFVTYERRLGSDPVDGVRLHLRIGENWSISTDAATDESAGADLIWSFDY